jgi:hypothetical protein
MKAYTIKYYGQQINGTYGEYTNKRTARKIAHEMAKGNCQVGASITWYVEDLDGNEIYKGTVRN